MLTQLTCARAKAWVRLQIGSASLVMLFQGLQPALMVLYRATMPVSMQSTKSNCLLPAGLWTSLAREPGLQWDLCKPEWMQSSFPVFSIAHIFIVSALTCPQISFHFLFLSCMTFEYSLCPVQEPCTYKTPHAREAPTGLALGFQGQFKTGLKLHGLW